MSSHGVTEMRKDCSFVCVIKSLFVDQCESEENVVFGGTMTSGFNGLFRLI